MATRSRIGIVQKDRTIKSIYCHWDGYPSYNGKILLNYYSRKELVEELIELNDISSLGYTTIDTNSYWKWRQEVALARVDKNKTEYKKRFGDCWEEYLYLFDNGKWYVYNKYEYKKWTPLEDIPECKEEE